MENFNGFFSVKDFFNYYIAGVIWLLSAALVFLWVPGPANPIQRLSIFQAQADSIGLLIAGVLAVFLPYVIGFVASPWCYEVARNYRTKYGDPVQWITDYSEGKYKGRRLTKPASHQIDELAQCIFPYNYSKPAENNNIDRWFYQIRAYVIHKGGAASARAVRAGDLMNFTESLLLPIPLLSIILVMKLTMVVTNAVRLHYFYGLTFGGVLSLILCIIIFRKLAERHLGYREYWVKHIYRAFFVLVAEHKKEAAATNKK